MAYRSQVHNELDRTVESIRACIVDHSPFSHFLLEEAFSDAFCQLILENLPDDDEFNFNIFSGPNESQRGVINLNMRRHTKRMSREKRIFWLEIARYLSSSKFITSVTRKFSRGIRDRFANAQHSIGSFYCEAKLLRDKSGYGLLPHTDSPNRVATLMFYLPRDEGMARYGTTIYAPKREGFTCIGKNRHPYDLFDEIKTVPFLPRTGLGFMKSNKSFHGVKVVSEPAAGRDILTFSIRYFDDPPSRLSEITDRLRGNTSNLRIGSHLVFPSA